MARLVLNGMSDELLNNGQWSFGAQTLEEALATRTESGSPAMPRALYMDYPAAGYVSAAGHARSPGVYDIYHGATASVTVDTIAGNATTTATLGEGQSVSSVVDTVGDQDWFAVTLQAGFIYTFNLTGSGDPALQDPYLELINSSGTKVAFDDDSGPDHDSLLSYYVQTGGTYYISAESFQNSAPYTNMGGYTLSLAAKVTPAVDAIAASTSTTATLTLGHSQNNAIDTPGDSDWFAVNLTAGTGYDFDLNGVAGFDVSLKLYDSNGNLIAANNDFSTGTDSHIDFEPDYSGKYYLSAGGSGAASYGGYSIAAAVGARPLLTDSIDWGTKLNPVGGVVHIYFAQAGETYDGETSLGWNAYEIQQVMQALSVYAQYINLTFAQVTDPNGAEFKLVTANDLATNVLAFMNPPGTTDAGVGVFARNGYGWSQTAGGGLDAGGLGFDTILHELGHGLGLAHPFDSGGTSTVMTGVLSSTNGGDYSGYGYQNQGVYTVMSYNDGWPSAYQVGATTGYRYGYDRTPMAIDVAALQGKYGINPNINSGDTTYALDTVVGQGSYRSIWDTGGTDTITADAATAGATINLNAASMYYSGTASGGAVSYVNGVNGGLTIDSNVTIENATGSHYADTLTGTDSANVLRGNGGSDNIYGMGGDDTIYIAAAVFGGGTFVDGGAGSDTVYFDFAHSLISSSGSGYYSGANVGFTVFNASVYANVVLTGVESFVFTDMTVDFNHVFNAKPILAGTLSAPVVAGSSHVLTAAELSFTDSNDPLGTTYYVQAADKLGTTDFAGGTVHGMITINGVQAHTFTSQQLAAGQVAFVQDGTADTSSTFTVAAFDGIDYSAAITFGMVTGTLHGDHLYIAGTSMTDTIDVTAFTGGAGANTLVGYGGDDTYVVNSIGNVIVEAANEGFDTVRSSVSYSLSSNVERLVLTGAGNIEATGNAQNNYLMGNDGNNILDGGGGIDTMYGGGGNDTYYVDNAADVPSEMLQGVYYIDAGGYDTIMASVDYTNYNSDIEALVLVGSALNGTGNFGNDTISGNAGNNVLDGSYGDDVLIGGAGADTLKGGDGIDTASYATAAAGLTVFMGGPQLNTGEAAGDSYVAIENLAGTNFADILGGDNGNNTVSGNDGNDWLFGSGGLDALQGGNGNDVLEGGAGADALDGGAGTDVASYRNATSGIVLDLVNSANSSGDATGDSLNGVENIWGSVYNDTIRSNLSGGGQVYGFEGNDVLVGFSGNDVFYGGTGSDTITTGAGADDIFFLSYSNHTNQYGTPEPYEGGDTITDFQHGVDHLTVSRYWFGFGNVPGPAAALTSTYADFITAGTTSVSSKPTFFWNDVTKVLQFDPDGTGASAMVQLATLTGATLTLDDIWTA